MQLTEVGRRTPGTRLRRLVTVSLPTRSIVAIVGPNGSGKSTIARMIAGLEPTESGQLSLVGGGPGAVSELLPAEPPWDRAKRGIFLLPADEPVFEDFTVEENLLAALAPFRLPPQTRRGILDGIRRRIPLTDARAGTKAGVLSGGEKRILGIARVVLLSEAAARARNGLSGPGYRLIVLDEPSRGLHEGAVASVANLLKHVAADGVAILILEQTQTLADLVADTIIHLADGEPDHAHSTATDDRKARGIA
ncbi:MAG: ATP-binding cassette domain-containing protein [Thermoanaerobaculia bacterium]